MAMPRLAGRRRHAIILLHKQLKDFIFLVHYINLFYRKALGAYDAIYRLFNVSKGACHERDAFDAALTAPLGPPGRREGLKRYSLITA